MRQGQALKTREQALHSRVELLRNDHTSSSFDLTNEALDIAEDWLRGGLDPTRLSGELSVMHPGIAAIANVARVLESRSALKTRLKALRESLRAGNQSIAENLARLVSPENAVITLSRSATVLDALIHIGVRSVYVLRSAPGGEGTLMAEELRQRLAQADLNSAVHLIEATTMGNVIPHVDCAVVGVDAISRSGAILHKVGTLPLALCCRYFKKPFYVVGHSLKRIDEEFEAPPDSNGVPETAVFDCTPAELIKRIVTEEALAAARSAT